MKKLMVYTCIKASKQNLHIFEYVAYVIILFMWGCTLWMIDILICTLALQILLWVNN